MWNWPFKHVASKRGHPQILVWGGTSQAKLIISMVEEQSLGDVRLVFDPCIDEPTFKVRAVFAREHDQLVHQLPHITNFVVCIGGARGESRCEIGQSLEECSLEPLAVISERCYVDSTVVVGKGLQAMPGAVLNKYASLGNFCIVNSNATVEHDCLLGDGVHVMSGATLTGGVVVEDYASIGANATVLPSVRIGKGALIGAGAVVTRDIEPYAVVAGVPATFRRYRHPQTINPMRKLTS